MPAPDFRLCLVTDRAATRGRPLARVVQECLAAGLRAVQLRDKELRTGELFQLAGELRALTWRHGARLFLNDRADIALAVGADGLHLPADGLPSEIARRVIGFERSLGVSTHSASEAETAARGGADFVFFGPIYDTPAKRAHGAPQGLAPLAATCQRSPVPVLAIGGVTAARVAELSRAGAAGVAVIRALLEHEDPARATKEMLAACEEAWR